jgi:hypothetical protein
MAQPLTPDEWSLRGRIASGIAITAARAAWGLRKRAAGGTAMAKAKPIQEPPGFRRGL